MPFDEEEKEIAAPKRQLKQVSSQKSIFESIPQKPTQDDLNNKVKQITDQSSLYKVKAADLSSKFVKIILDKTLKQNKSIFSLEMEKDILSQMISLGVEINNDTYEQEGMGSMGWITLLFKISLSQRDRINQLEYELSLLKKECDPLAIKVLIANELKNLDKKKNDG